MKQRYSSRHNKLREILIDARLKAGLKQQDLSKKLKRGKNFVSDVERGVRMVDALELIDYAEAIDLDPERIIRKLRARLER